MSKTFQVFLVAIILIVLGLYVGPMLIDWNRYKPQAEAWLTQRTGHAVKIRGDFSLRILPQPQIDLNMLDVANAPGAGAPSLLTAGRLEARIAILPLFTGRLVVTALKLEEPSLALERLADGKLNLGSAADVLRPRPIRVTVPAGFSLVPHQLMVSDVEIAHGRLSYRDAQLDWSETTDGINATFVALGDDGPYRARAGFNWMGRAWTLATDAETQSADGVRPITILLDQADSGLKAQISGRLKGVGMAAQLAGAFSLQLASPGTMGAGAAAFGNAAQNSAAPPLRAEGALVASAGGVSLRDMALRWGDFGAQGGLEAKFGDKPGDRPSFVFKLAGSLLNLDAVRPDLVAASRIPYWPIAALQLFSTANAPQAATPARGFGSVWDGSLDVKLDAIVFGQGRIANPVLTASVANGVMEIKDLALILPGDTELHVQGKTMPMGGFDGQAQLVGERARELFLWAGVPVQSVEEGRLTHLAYKGGLQIMPGSMRLQDFEAVLDGSAAKGLLALSRPAQSGPQIEADLQVTRMNVDPYRALFGSNVAPLQTVLEIVDATSGPVKLAVDTLVADGYEARGLILDLNLSAAGGVTIRGLKINDLLGAGLDLTGSGKALSGAATLSLKGTATALDLRPLLARLGIAARQGEAALGPATLTVSADIKDGTGEAIADGYLAGARAGTRVVLTKADAPLVGRLGAGTLGLNVVAQGPSMIIAGRLAGYDPPIGKPGAPYDPQVPSYNSVPNDGPVPLGWVFLSFWHDVNGTALRAGAGLSQGTVTLSSDRHGDPGSGSYALKLDASAPDATQLFAELGVPEARRSFLAGPLSISVTAQGPSNAIAVTQSVSLGAMMLNGEGTLDLTQVRPVFAGSLKGNAIDLDALRGLLPKHIPSNDVPGPWSEEPLDLSVLGHYDGTLAVEAERVTLFHLPLAAPKFSLALKDGLLNINDLRASLFNGPLTANLALRGGAELPGFAASVKFIDMDGAALTKSFWSDSFIAAPLSGSLSLTTQGANTAALAAAANGQLQVKSAAGTIRGLNRANAADPGPFLELGLNAQIANGIADLSDGHITVSNGPVRITGHAALAPYTIDLATDDGKPTQILVEGPLDAPKRKTK